MSGSVVVKKAWKRQVSNKVACPAPAFGFRSGIRRTTSRPGTWSAFFFEVNAVKSSSATSAREIQVSVVWSKTASVYWIVCQVSSSMVAMAAFTRLSRRTVTDTSAPALIAADTVGCP